MKKIVLFILAITVLNGCGNRQEEKAGTEKNPSALKVYLERINYGTEFLVFKNEERTIKVDTDVLKSKPYYIGEYYGSGYIWEDDDWKWRKFTYSDKDDEIDGFIKIKNNWVSKDRVIMYEDIPDRYELLRKQVERKTKCGKASR